MRNRNNNNDPDSLLEIGKGVLLVCAFNVLAGFVIFMLGQIKIMLGAFDTAIFIWIVGVFGLYLWQLVYVLPLAIWLKRQGKTGMMNGAIIGAALTILIVPGGCYLFVLLVR